MNKTTKSILTATAIVAVSAGVAGFTSYAMMQPEQSQQTMTFEDVFQVDPNARLAALNANDMQPIDLTKAAESSVNAVVHIKSTQEAKTQTVTVRDPFYEFFGDMFGNRGGQQRQVQTPERVGFNRSAYPLRSMQSDIPFAFMRFKRAASSFALPLP